MEQLIEIVDQKYCIQKFQIAMMYSPQCLLQNDLELQSSTILLVPEGSKCIYIEPHDLSKTAIK